METVPTRPCPKCGCSDTDLYYRYSGGFEADDEFFTRVCTRCEYMWRTFDVMEKEDG